MGEAHDPDGVQAITRDAYALRFVSAKVAAHLAMREYREQAGAAYDVANQRWKREFDPGFAETDGAAQP